MIARCTCEYRHNYYAYGGRGISVCDEWTESFENFYSWSIDNGYEKGLSIERIDNDKGYSPDNCRFIPLCEQGKNRRSSKMIMYNGKTQCLYDWCRELGLVRTTIQNRMYHGLTFEEAITMPLRKRFDKLLNQN